MNQRALDEMRHRTGMDRPSIFYLWAISCTLGAIFLTWNTCRNGIWYILADPKDFSMWVICMMLLASLWRARPKKAPKDQIRLNLR